MNKETYKALKRIVKMYKPREWGMILPRVKIDFEKVEGWIEEVAKEYTE